MACLRALKTPKYLEHVEEAFMSDDESDQEPKMPKVWKCATLKKKDWSKHLKIGFNMKPNGQEKDNKDDEDEEEEEEQKEEEEEKEEEKGEQKERDEDDEEEEDQDEDEEEDGKNEEEQGKSQILAVKIMAEKLEKHFEFGFTEDLVQAPHIWGGYA